MSVLILHEESAPGGLNVCQVTVTTNPQTLAEFEPCPYVLCYGESLDVLIVDVDGTVQKQTSLHNFIEVKDEKGQPLQSRNGGVFRNEEQLDMCQFDTFTVTLKAEELLQWIRDQGFKPATINKVCYLDRSLDVPSTCSLI